MSHDLFHFAVSPLELILRAVVIYAFLLLLLRIFGKRQVGQFTLYDLVFVLLVANALQPAITGPDVSLGGGLVIAVALVLLNFLVGRLDLNPRFHGLLAPGARRIVEHGQVDKKAMNQEGIDEDDLMSALREHGLTKIDDCLEAYLEPDGSISVIAKEGSGSPRRRRRRLFRHSRG